MRRTSFAVGALVLLAPVGAAAETITITTRMPARYAEPSLMRRLVIGQFSGQWGAELANAIAAELGRTSTGVEPHFTIVTAARGSGVGVLSGSASINVDEQQFTDQQSRCVEGAGFFKCRRSETIAVSCTRRLATATVTIQMARAVDGRVIYSTRKPYQSRDIWCEGSPPPDSGTQFLAAIPAIAREIAGDIAPQDVSYKVRLLETAQGLGKEAAKSFRQAVKISTRDLSSACTEWSRLAASGENGPALVFGLGVCAEQRGDLAAAEQSYHRAQTLLPGNTIVAEGVARIRQLGQARQQAIAQQAQRAQIEAAEQRRAEAEARASRAAASAEKRKRDRQKAEAVAAKDRERQAVVRQYGADAADAIMAGTVRKGMTPQQVRAVVGGNCRIQRISPGEEQWTCSNKRIVFSGGRVTFVR